MEKAILLPLELKAIIIALQSQIDDSKHFQQRADIPFTPEARTAMKEIIEHSESAMKKLQVVVNKGEAFHLAEYKEGDENEFLIKKP